MWNILLLDFWMKTDTPKLSNTHKLKSIDMPSLSYEEYKLVRIYNAIFIDLCAKDKKLNNFLLKMLKCMY